MNSAIFGLLIALLTFVGQTAYDRAKTLGALRKEIVNVHGAAAGDIKVIPDTINAEDLHYDAASGLIFTAAQGQDVRHLWFPPLGKFADPSAAARGDGGLRIIDPATFTTTKLTLEGFSGPFVTHGIDITADPSDPNARYILAVNHLPDPTYEETLDATLPVKAASQIEIFHHVLGSTVARHVRSVQHSMIRTPNDITATGPSSFFVTNDHGVREGAWRVFEDLGTDLLAGWSDTMYVDASLDGTGSKGVKANIALRGLHNNNGLGNGPDGSVIVNDAAGGVSHFAVIPDANSKEKKLEVRGRVKLSTTIDNPFWFADPYPEVGGDASGLLNSGLLKALDLAHSVEHGPIPSVVWLSRPLAPVEQDGKLVVPGDWNTTQLFADDGGVLRSASAAVLVAIDPKTNKGRKQAWLFASGFSSSSAVAVKVDL